MKTSRKRILNNLKTQIARGEHIIGVATGSGLTARNSVKGGADLVLALSAGKFRQTGRSSLASFMCYRNSNEIVESFAANELVTLLRSTPVLFGLNATDPSIDLEDYIMQIRDQGLAGIVNFPTVGMIDGQFRQALEEEGTIYNDEVRAIRIAHDAGLFTIAFVFDRDQASQMIDAGADIICAHLGLTTGGDLGARKVQSIKNSVITAREIFKVCDERAPGIIKMIYGGPVKSPEDAEIFYQNGSNGFIGGSSFERIPAEKVIEGTVRSFKRSADAGNSAERQALMNILQGRAAPGDYVEMVQEYVSKNYRSEVRLDTAAASLHLTPTYLSRIFKNKLGISFTQYVVDFRMHKAEKFLKDERLAVEEVAGMCGYKDPAQFSKMFRKHTGHSPSEYRKLYLLTNK